MPNPESGPEDQVGRRLACSSKMASQPFSERSRTPFSSPPPATTDWMSATDRALP